MSGRADQAHLPPAARAWVADVIGDGARVRRCRSMPGATSSAVTALDVETERGSLLRLVLRQYVDEAVLASEPRAVEREAAVLAAVAYQAVPVPRLVGTDPTGAGCGVPALLMTRLPGSPKQRPRGHVARFLDDLAAPLVDIHAARCPAEPTFPAYRPYHPASSSGPLGPPAWTSHHDAWTRAIAVHAAPMPSHASVLIHRDYHPGNVLWSRGAITGVVDWAWGCRGPAAVDVAHCRTNLVLSLGADAADRFLGAWQRAAGVHEYDPSWDLRDAVDLSPDLDAPTRPLARLDEHVARAAAHL